jgi:hypothetical protein
MLLHPEATYGVRKESIDSNRLLVVVYVEMYARLILLERGCGDDAT